MPADLRIGVREHAGTLVLHLEGELDLSSARYLEGAIQRAQEAGSPVVVIDTERLWFIDMAGLRVLIAARERAEQEGQSLLLTNVHAPLRRVLTLGRAAELLPEVNGEGRYVDRPSD